MKVQIEDNLYIESDERQFIIKEYTGAVDKDGREMSKTHGYYPSIKHCLNHIVKMKTMQSTATTLQGLVEDVKRIEAFVESKLA